MEKTGGCSTDKILEKYNLALQIKRHAQGLMESVRPHKEEAGSWQKGLDAVKDYLLANPQSHLCSLLKLGAVEVRFREVRVNGGEPKEMLFVYFPHQSEDVGQRFVYFAFFDNPPENNCVSCVS